MFPSIRAQLTAWLALLVTLCLTAFAVYLYLAVGQLLTADMDQTLRVQAQQVAATYHFDAPDSGDKERDEQHVDTSVGNEFAGAGVLAEVFDTQPPRRPCRAVSCDCMPPTSGRRATSGGRPSTAAWPPSASSSLMSDHRPSAVRL